MADYSPPDFVDRATVEWCAQTIDHLAALLLRHWPDHIERRIGIEASAGTLRAMLLLMDAPPDHPEHRPPPQLRIVA